MRVLIAGAHGKTARRLTRMLVEDGHEIRGLVRKEEQTDDVEADGAEPVLVDLEAEEVKAGSGVPSRGATLSSSPPAPVRGAARARKETMDYGGAAKLVEAAEGRGVRRYLMLSAMGASDPEGGSEGHASLSPRQGPRRRAAEGERPRLHHHPPRRPDRGRGHRQHRGGRKAWGEGVRSPAKTSPVPSPTRSKTRTRTKRPSRSYPGIPRSRKRSHDSEHCQHRFSISAGQVVFVRGRTCGSFGVGSDDVLGSAGGSWAVGISCLWRPGMRLVER